MQPDNWELPAIEHGGAMGGEYLESIGKTDLAQLTADEWSIFISCVCLNYHSKRAELEPCPF